MKGARHKAQGVRQEEESTALRITIPVGASSACDKRICGSREYGFQILDCRMTSRIFSRQDASPTEVL